MTKRLLAIGQRSAEADEKVKSVFTWMLVLLAGVGAFAVYSWGKYWVSNEPAYLLTETKMAWISIATLAAFIYALFCAVSLRMVRLSYHESTYLKEVEKGHHDPIVSQYEPIREVSQLEEKREFKIGVSRGNQTDFVPMDMTANQVIDTLDRLPLTANQIKLYLEEYKTWEPVSSYLRKRKERANIEALQNMPDTIERGREVYFPV